MPPRVRKPDSPTYPHAEHPLTDAEVREQYGPLLDRFYAALQEDGHLVADMAAAIMKACEKYKRRLATAARYRQAKVEREAAVSR